MTTDKLHNITLSLRPDKGTADKLSTLLQRGFLLPVTGTVSIAELLLPLPGFSDEYISRRIQTIFVNGLAQDSTDRALTAGDTLALSAAMPGLAGAILRRGGRHASLRTRPTADTHQKPRNPGHITLKLFNMIAAEAGPQLLTAGLLIRGRVLARFLDRQAERILPAIERAEVDTAAVPPAELAGIAAENDILFLTMRS